jgi:hypothetical protein
MSLRPDPINLINALKEEMSPQNKSFISALINIEIKKNEKEIMHLRNQLVVNRGGKFLTELQRKNEIKNRIELLEIENELLR